MTQVVGGDATVGIVARRYQPKDLRDLAPYARNSKKHSGEQIALLEASLKEFGWTRPVAQADGTILAGHGVVLAALNIAKRGECPRDWPNPWVAPTVDLSHLSEEQRRAYVIADNRLAEKGATWDNELLVSELGALHADGFDVTLTGFDAADLAKLGAGGTGEGLTDPDETPEPPEHPVAQPGDVWLLGRHRLACGDSTDPLVVDRALAGVKPHLMVTDPPYGVNYDPSWRHATGLNNSARVGKVQNDDKADWRDAWALFPGDVAYIWHGALHATTVAESLAACDFQIRSQIIWAKPRFVIGRGDYHWQHEPCWYAVRKGKTGHYGGDRKQTTLWQIEQKAGAEDDATVHGTQKPVECMRRPIENNSSPGQAIYEPFSGSGTTIIAAEISGRACHAVELDPVYVDVAVKRWQNFTGQEAILEGDGRSFAQVGASRPGKDA